MPEFVNKSVLSSTGSKLELSTNSCPLEEKKSKNFFLTSEECI